MCKSGRAYNNEQRTDERALYVVLAGNVDDVPREFEKVSEERFVFITRLGSIPNILQR